MFLVNSFGLIKLEKKNYTKKENYQICDIRAKVPIFTSLTTKKKL